MPIPPPRIRRFYQTGADKRFILKSGPPATFIAGETASSASHAYAVVSSAAGVTRSPAMATSDAATSLPPPQSSAHCIPSEAAAEADYPIPVAAHYRVHFNLDRGLPSATAPGAVVFDLGPLDPPSAPGECWTADFHVPELEHTVYYVCIRAVHPLTGEESDNTDQRIVPICELLPDPVTAIAYGPRGAIYTRDPESRCNNGQPVRLLRSFDQGDSWEVLCTMPGDSGEVPGFAVDSKGYIYLASSPTPCVSRDDGQTFEPMRGPSGEAVNLAHATQFWYPAWNVSELSPGAHPQYPDGAIFLSTYANNSGRGPCDPDWMKPDPSRVWYDGEGNIESDQLGRGYRIFSSRDAERRVWEYVDIADYDFPNDPSPSGVVPLADRHIHGFKINPYAPEEWYLSTGDGVWVAETEANFARFGASFPYNWIWEGDFSKRRGLYRFDSSFGSVTQLRGPNELNGPTGLAFFPDGSLLVSDDNANWAGAAGVGAGVHRYNRDGGQIEFFNPSALDPRLAGVMYDAITIEGTNIAFVTIDDDSRMGRSDTAILTNLNGVWEALIQLPAHLNIEMLSADSRKLIPRDAQYLFANVLGLGGIRIPLGRLARG